jgi:hypothetical protein
VKDAGSKSGEGKPVLHKRWKSIPTVALAVSLYLSMAGTAAMAQTDPGKQRDTAGKNGKRGQKDPPPPDLMPEIEKMRADFEQKLAEQETAAKARDESLRKEQAAAVEEARKEAEARLATDRNERQAEVAELHKALAEAAAHEDAREKNAPPVVRSSTSGVTLYGYIQGDWQIRQSSEDQLDPVSGQPINQDRFLIRRARLGAAIDKHYGEGRIEIDGNTVQGPALRLIDVEASVKWPGKVEGEPPLVMGTIGLLRIPFGAEVEQDDRRRLFMERSTAARALFSGEYDLGARISGGWHFIRYALAAQNGQPLGGSSFVALDPNHQKDLVGRLGVEDRIREKVDVAGGVSVLRGTGFHSGKLASKSTVQWNDIDENGSLNPSSELVGTPASAATPSSNFTRFGFGADLLLSSRLWRLGRSSLAAEFYLANDLDRALVPADPNGSIGRNFRELGYYVALSQEIGPFQVGVRYDYYNPDQDSNKNARGNPVPTDMTYSTVAIAAACVSSWGRFIVEYDRNRNHLGIDPNGMPSNLADNAVIVRGEVGF